MSFSVYHLRKSVSPTTAELSRGMPTCRRYTSKNQSSSFPEISSAFARNSSVVASRFCVPSVTPSINESGYDQR